MPQIEPVKQFMAEIEEARQDMGISHNDFCAKAELARNSYYNYRAGYTTPSAKAMETMAKAAGGKLVICLIE